MRDLVLAVSGEATDAWSKRTGRAKAAQKLIHRVSSISRAAEMLRLRNRAFDVGLQVVAFRRAVTNDIENGSVALVRREKIVTAAAELDEAIYRRFIKIYG